MKRLRIAAADWSDTCCAVIEVDERLERVRLQRRPVAGEGRDERPERLVASRPGVEAVEIERQAEEATRLGLDGGVVRCQVDAAGRGLDPHLAAGEDTVQAVIQPERRPVDAVDPIAGDREREVVRLRQRDEQMSRVPDTCLARVRHRLSASRRKGLLPIGKLVRRLALFAFALSLPGPERRRGRRLVGAASDQGGRRGGFARRAGRGLQAEAAADAEGPRGRARDALARRVRSRSTTRIRSSCPAARSRSASSTPRSSASSASATPPAP